MPAQVSLGLCGFPLGHSISPALHQAALQATGLTGSYTLYPIPPLPDGQALLAALLERLRNGALQGLNVTIPHKQAVIPLLDHLTSTAQAIGAVNTLYSESGQLIGDNTDAPGFLADLVHLPLSGEKEAIVLGAGGAARAVVYALVQQGWQVHIAARQAAQANELANALSPDANRVTTSHLDDAALRAAARTCRLIVNTTPVGMTPHTDGNPWPANLPLPGQACLYDLVYNPAETRLVRAARAAGLPARSGLGMLVEQAALAFERWTGRQVSRSVLLQAVPSELLPRNLEPRREV